MFPRVQRAPLQGLKGKIRLRSCYMLPTHCGLTPISWHGHGRCKLIVVLNCDCYDIVVIPLESVMPFWRTALASKLPPPLTRAEGSSLWGLVCHNDNFVTQCFGGFREGGAKPKKRNSIDYRDAASVWTTQGRGRQIRRPLPTTVLDLQ